MEYQLCRGTRLGPRVEHPLALDPVRGLPQLGLQFLQLSVPVKYDTSQIRNEVEN